MDKLLEQAAKALKIPVDVMEQAVNHYPELRQQFVIYKALTRSWEETLPESEAAFDRSRIFCHSEDCRRNGFENHSFDYTRIKLDLGIKPVSPDAPTEVLDDLERRIFAWQC